MTNSSLLKRQEKKVSTSALLNQLPQRQKILLMSHFTLIKNCAVHLKQIIECFLKKKIKITHYSKI